MDSSVSCGRCYRDSVIWKKGCWDEGGHCKRAEAGLPTGTITSDGNARGRPNRGDEKNLENIHVAFGSPGFEALLCRTYLLGDKHISA